MKRIAALAKILSLLLILQVAPVAAQDISLPGTSDSESPAPSAAPIPLASPDAAIRSRLVTLYSQVSGLDAVRVHVRNGVVTLTGTALDPEASAKAEGIASRLDGVVSVENHLEVEHRVERRLQPLIAKTEQMMRDTIAFLPLLVVALVVFVGFWLLGRVITRRTRLFRRIAPNQFIEMLFEQVVRLIFILVGLVTAMSILGATALIGSVLGAAGVIGLAVGFAVRDTIENYIASILLSVRRPFAPNDVVNIEGFEGKIALLNSRATVIIQGDGTQVRIPNATVYKSIITNLTHHPERRFEFEIGIGFENDITCALATAANAVSQVDGVIAEPRPAVLVDRFAEYVMIIKVLAWVDQQKSDFGKTKSEAIRAVKEAFDAEHISIPEPIQNARAMPDAVQVDRSGQTSKPTAEDRAAIADTSIDRTIDEKVHEARAGAEEDLLTRAAPRE